MRYEYIDIEEVKNNGSKIIRELDLDNENKTEIINEYVLRPSSIKEALSLKSALMALKNLPDDNASISEVKKHTEQAYKDIQDKFLNAFVRAVKLDEMTEKKEDVLVTDFSEWASYGSSIDIPYTKLAAKALNEANQEYKGYILNGYFSFLPEDASYSEGKKQYHKKEDFGDLIKHVVTGSFNYPDRINSLIQISNFVKGSYSYDNALIEKVEKDINKEITGSELGLLIELSRQSPENMFNIQSENVDFTPHISMIQKHYKHTEDTIPNFNKVGYANSSMEQINKLIEVGVFDADISYLQFIGSGMKETKSENNTTISTIYDIYHNLPSEEMRESLENAVSIRDLKLLQTELKSRDVTETKKNKMRP